MGTILGILSGLFQLPVFLEKACAAPGLQSLVAVAPGTHSLINWLFGKWGLCVLGSVC